MLWITQSCQFLTLRTLTAFTLASVTFMRCACAYELRDPVPMVMRTAMGSSTLAHWADVQSSVSPIFGINSQALITPEFQKRPLSTENKFHVAFSISHHQFETNFIQIADGVGGFTKEIVFDIEFAGHDVLALHYQIVHFDPPPRSPPETISLRYTWHERPTADPEQGIFALFLIGMIAALIGAISSCRSEIRKAQ